MLFLDASFEQTMKNSEGYILRCSKQNISRVFKNSLRVSYVKNQNYLELLGCLTKGERKVDANGRGSINWCLWDATLASRTLAQKVDYSQATVWETQHAGIILSKEKTSGELSKQTAAMALNAEQNSRVPFLLAKALSAPQPYPEREVSLTSATVICL